MHQPLSPVGACSNTMPTVFGLPVLDGIVMRVPGAYAVAVRRQTGEIVVRDGPWQAWTDGHGLARWPVIRGILALSEIVRLWLWASLFALKQADVFEPLASACVGMTQSDRSQTERLRLAKEGLALLLLATALCLVGAGLPTMLAYVWDRALQTPAPDQPGFYVVLGALQLGLWAACLRLSALIPSVQRFLMYHGACHQSVAAFLSNVPLEQSCVQRFTHVRGACRVGWLVWAVLLRVVLHTAAASAGWRLAQGLVFGSLWGAFAMRLVLWIAILGVAYEVHRLTSMRLQRPWIRAFVAPGVWLQRFTVYTPSATALEVALVALRAALSRRGRYAQQARQQRLGLAKLVGVCTRHRLRVSPRMTWRASGRSTTAPFAVSARTELS